MEQKKITGHLLALFTIILWGTTYVSTKILLTDFKPVEILYFRFIMGYVFLIVLCPHFLKVRERKQELYFMAAGLCGICLYYLLENIALTYTMASNVGVIISVAPFFTAIVIHVFAKEDERFNWNFLFGFLIALAGICIISFNGSQLRFSPLGDVLAVSAALAWAFYSLFLREIGRYDLPNIAVTRHIFFYGIVFLIPALPFFDVRLDPARFLQTENWANLLFLGFGASALCFVIWNFAVKQLGAVKTSVYIYLSPAITVIASAILLRERITPLSAAGTVLTLAGLLISEYRPREKEVFRGKDMEKL